MAIHTDTGQLAARPILVFVGRRGSNMYRSNIGHIVHITIIIHDIFPRPEILIIAADIPEKLLHSVYASCTSDVVDKFVVLGVTSSTSSFCFPRNLWRVLWKWLEMRLKVCCRIYFIFSTFGLYQCLIYVDQTTFGRFGGADVTTPLSFYRPGRLTLSLGTKYEQ